MTAGAIIHVRFSTSRLHRWAGAPEHRAYLSAFHRHKFMVKVSCAVLHDDREIEFHDLLDESYKIFTEDVPESSDMSCEMMARALGERLAKAHSRWFKVEVWEDGECGAEVCSTPPPARKPPSV